MAITPDTKNWTWVIEKACPECGFDGSAISAKDVAGLVRENAAQWPAVLQRADVTKRPDDATWSALEYAAHVRDVFRRFDTRLALMLEEDAPEFEDWDQDRTAVEENYAAQDPDVVARELVAAAERVAADFERVPVQLRGRAGLRSDGSRFTVDTLARYFVHDPVHHLWDVTR